MADAIERFADHVVGTRYEDLPTEAVSAAKTFILDSLGVALAGTLAPHVAEMTAAFKAAVPGDGARVWGSGVPLPPPAAAAVNGYLIHNSEFDCVHEAAVLHPMATLLSALLAEAEARGGVDGRALVRAVVLGVDVSCHIGCAVTSGLRFFRPATAGGFGAVAAIAAAVGLDRERLLDAFGIYYAQAGGTMQAHTEGLPLLGMQAGFDARNAVIAVRLAEAGIPGTRGTLEGPFGYLRLMEERYDPDALTRDLGRVWRITEVAHKPFPSGRATHGLIDALRELMAEHGIAGGEVAQVTGTVPPLTHRLIGRPVTEAMTPNYARLSGPYCAARLLLTGDLGIADFTADALADPATLDLGRRIVVEADGNPDPNALTPVTATVTLRDGRVLERRIATVYGNPAKPMSREAHLAKFRSNLGAVGLPERTGDHLLNLVERPEHRIISSSIVDQLMIK